MRASLLLGLGLSAALLSPLGCGADSGGDSTSSSGTPEAGDGKVHPKGNGTHQTEQDACAALTSSQTMLRLHLSCVGTSFTCPAFLRAQFSTPCLEYDQGSVAGCIAYYGQAASCADLSKAIDDCAVTPFPGTTSAGCTM